MSAKVVHVVSVHEHGNDSHYVLGDGAADLPDVQLMLQNRAEELLDELIEGNGEDVDGGNEYELRVADDKMSASIVTVNGTFNQQVCFLEITAVTIH